ncbi:hypothetical protein MKX08_008739, partial [Trichoderma sp. CBMAI-0020]
QVTMGLKQLLHGDYTIGWICALPLEQTAAMYMLDERHKDLQNPLSDENTYTLGRIGGHNVVIVGLPKGRIGTNDSAAVITRMASTFPNIKFGMMVGVGGGIPEKTRLGDVVICSAVGTNAGVVQHDLGTRAGDRFETRGFLSGPPTAVLTALGKFQADPLTPGQMHSHLDDMATIPHVDVGGDCSSCDERRIKPRAPRRTDFEIHYGLVASGNTKVKDAKLRDELCRRYKNNLYCIEMEAAGLMNNFPCVVIRGICDYADSHASKEWQHYAAAVAAACTKTLLGVVPEREVRRLQSVQDSVASSNIGASRQYHMRHHVESPPPSPQKFEGNAASAPRMIEWQAPSYYNDFPSAGSSKFSRKKSEDKDWAPLAEGERDTKGPLPNFHPSGGQQARLIEEEIAPPQTPPRSPRRNNPGHPRRPEDGSSLERRNTDLGSTQPLLGGDLSDPATTGIKKRRSYTFPNTDPAVLFNAIKTGDIATIQRELKNGAALEVTDKIGFTPLWRAVHIGEGRVIQLLLNGGANYEANLNGQNILEWALKKGKADIVDMICTKIDENLRLSGDTAREVN